MNVEQKLQKAVVDEQVDRGEKSLRRRDGLLTTGDMARISRNTLRTVRFYEEAGLLTPVHRTDGGHRLFPQSELRKLQLISDLRGAGFSLEEIRDTIDSKSRQTSGPSAAGELLARLDDQVNLMRERLVLLERLVKELEASRLVLKHCASCKHTSGFPGNCQDCPELPSQLPNAVSVLWQIDR